ncbi:hypothetical protein GY45DRAFT_799240 [Cubamyces sp. BRFM 1775]|nr:hypothetical protein GY45DRAFT_799240 [Cubamyces sp. BRFM 1775]
MPMHLSDGPRMVLCTIVVGVPRCLSVPLPPPPLRPRSSLTSRVVPLVRLHTVCLRVFLALSHDRLLVLYVVRRHRMACDCSSATYGASRIRLRIRTHAHHHRIASSRFTLTLYRCFLDGGRVAIAHTCCPWIVLMWMLLTSPSPESVGVAQ